jgi:MOSC domain-containing protein YiiM
MFEGRLIAIYTASGEGAPMVAINSIQAVKGSGLEGDRYANGTGHYSARGGAGREVTLIEREAIAAVNAEQDLNVGEHETRRNLLTEGVPLNHLVGRTFRVGTVVFYGCRLADPCAYLAGLTAKEGLARALANRAGLRADILVGGLLQVGDEIVEIEAAEIDVPG